MSIIVLKIKEANCHINAMTIKNLDTTSKLPQTTQKNCNKSRNEVSSKFLQISQKKLNRIFNFSKEITSIEVNDREFNNKSLSTGKSIFDCFIPRNAFH